MVDLVTVIVGGVVKLSGGEDMEGGSGIKKKVNITSRKVSKVEDSFQQSFVYKDREKQDRCVSPPSLFTTPGERWKSCKGKKNSYIQMKSEWGRIATMEC